MHVRVKIKAEALPQSQSRMLSLWEACVRGDITAVRLAVQGGADVNETDGVTMTPLMWAAHRGKSEISKLLLQQPGINIDCSDEDGRTAMHYACLFGCLEVLRMLLASESRGSINQPDKGGCTPLMCASNYGHVECVKLMVGVAGVDLETRYEVHTR